MLLTLTAIIVLQQEPAAKAAEDPISVCQLLENRAAYHGKLVTVRAMGGVGVGPSLVDGQCPNLRVGEVDWHAGVCLASSSEYVAGFPGETLTPKDWKTLRASAEREFRAKYPGANSKSALMYIVVSGLFETRPDQYLRQAMPRLGFGHLNRCPAQIAVRKTVRLELCPR